MFVTEILNLPRNTKRFILVVTDIIVLLVSLWLSFSLRLGELYLPKAQILTLYIATPIIAIPIFYWFGLYRTIIRYIGFLAMWSVIKAVSLYTLVWGLAVLLSATPGVPRSVLIINWIVTISLVVGIRVLAHWGVSRKPNSGISGASIKRVAIYGAGGAGIQTATALHSSPEYKPVAFIDDKPALRGNYIEGIRVYPFRRLSTLIEDMNVTDVLLAIPSASRTQRSKIISKLEPYSVHVTTLPGLDDLASGKIKVGDVREVGVRDLLGRIPVDPDQDLLSANVQDKVVLVTGAGGSIGSELCRQILRIKPSALILCERSEHDLYLIEKELTELALKLYPNSPDYGACITPILASVSNQIRMTKVCKAFEVETIYHAAAYKHVPIVEKNPSEAIVNNIMGTYRIAMAAIESGVDTFVLISTDKAVRPTNTMGATKRFAELILQGLATQKDISTRFTMVRFGNVLGSSGSVIPLFRDQIQKGGPVTVTDPKIIRYFMTIPEAAQLVIQAGAMGHGGDVFVLDMGDPVKILDMAKRLIHLSGLEVKDSDNPEGDVEIVYTGLRPGEKLYEELLIGENVMPTNHDLIMTANEEGLAWPDILDYMDKFKQAIESHNVEMCRSLLVESIKGFHPQCEVADLVLERNARGSTSAYKDNVIH